MSARPSTSSTHLPAAPSVPPAIHHLANPSPVLIDSQLPSYLLPNVLELLRTSSAHVIRRKRAEEDALRAEGLLPPLATGHAAVRENQQNVGNGKGKGRGSEGEEEEERLVDEQLGKRMERIGLMVGGYIAEKLTLARPPLASHLDIIKFICKDLFLYVYSKQIDNLRTNHRGIYVLQSHTFPPLIPLSSYKGQSADIEVAKTHLLFPQALIQGALTRLGMPAIVTAESAGLPQCTFQIRTIKTTLPTTPSAAGTPNPNPNPNTNPNFAGGPQAQAQGQGYGQAQIDHLNKHLPTPLSATTDTTSTSGSGSGSASGGTPTTASAPPLGRNTGLGING